MDSDPIKGRGAADNPANRFESLRYERDPDDPPADSPAPATQFFKDATRSIIAKNDSPDIPFNFSINPYRGCEHGCVYCYARPFHEYLGFSAGLDFETKILVKENAPALLRKELSAPSWKPEWICMSGVTDCYQPIERKLKITRGCLEVLAEFRNSVGIITKNHLVTRDIDILQQLARHDGVSVFIAVTSLDGEIAGKMEPRATAPLGRLQAIRELNEAGIPTGVMVAPVVPGLTDHEMPAILEAAREAGAKRAHLTILRLPHGLGDLFERWLDQHFPLKKDRVMSRVRELRDGKKNDSRFGQRMTGEGAIADILQQVFSKTCRKLGLNEKRIPLSAAAFRRPNDTPLTLFDGTG